MAKRQVGLDAVGETCDVHSIGDDGDAALGYAASHDVLLEAVADRRDVIGPAKRVRLERAARAVARSPLAGGSVINCRVLPECAHFVNERDPEGARHAQRRQGIQDRRMGVQDVGLRQRGNLANSPLRRAHQRKLAQHRHASERCRRTRGAIEVQSVDVLVRRSRSRVLRARDVKRLPSQAVLFAQDFPSTERVAALQG